jgi:hypothetical protein
MATCASLLARCSKVMIGTARTKAAARAAMTIKKVLLIPAPYRWGLSGIDSNIIIA